MGRQHSESKLSAVLRTFLESPALPASLVISAQRNAKGMFKITGGLKRFVAKQSSAGKQVRLRQDQQFEPFQTEREP